MRSPFRLVAAVLACLATVLTARPHAQFELGTTLIPRGAIIQIGCASITSVTVTLTADVGGQPPLTTTVAPATRAITAATLTASTGQVTGLSAAVTAGTSGQGSTWCRLRVQGPTGTVSRTLAAGFVSAESPLSWPWAGIMLGPLDGPGYLRSISGTTPAAGAEISETVPTGARWELIAFKARLTTDANVANRFPQLTIDDGTTVYFNGPSDATHTAGVAWTYNFAEGLMTPYKATITAILSGLPINNRLGAGHRIKTSTANIQVGDQWGVVQYLVREWMDL